MFTRTAWLTVSQAHLHKNSHFHPHVTITRNEQHCGCQISSIPITSFEPTEPDEVEITHNLSIFHSPSVTFIYDLGEKSTASPDQENDDEHIKNTLTSPLCLQERETSADLSQVHHSNEENLFPSLTVSLCKRGETRDNVLTEKGNPVKSWTTTESRCLLTIRKNDFSQRPDLKS